MPVDLYKRLCSPKLLRRAWHLARNDSRTDFMLDPYRFSEVGFGLDDLIHSISKGLTERNYHPKPLLTIDVPKSSLSVRPGSVLAIEDKIVLFAAAQLIAPILDRKLPDSVYSWRVRKGSAKELFADNELIKYPFLKGETIRKRLDFVEPWYGVWGKFISDLEDAIENKGYRYLVTSDVVAYFENIDLGLLRDLLLRHLPQQHRIVNFLINSLKYWTWPAINGAPVPRGIPQGNGVSSFLGNIYLLPLDQSFSKFSRLNGALYLRYMDDVKVLTKDMKTAREAVFLLNSELRGLRLNIQGTKTGILQGDAIISEVRDARLDSVNRVIEKLQKTDHLKQADRLRYVASLKLVVRQIAGRKRTVAGKELRLFRRLVTGFTLLRHPAMLRLILDQLQRNPDARLLNSAARYLRVQDRNVKRIAERLNLLLTSKDGLFPYQEAVFFMVMRHMRNIPPSIWKLAWSRAQNKKLHWYARQQAVLLLALKGLSKMEIARARTCFDRTEEGEIKRAWLSALCQGERQSIEEVARGLTHSFDPKLHRLGRFCFGLLTDEAKARHQIESVFRDFKEENLIGRLFEIELIARTRHPGVQADLLRQLVRTKKILRRPLLQDRIGRILRGLRAGDRPISPLRRRRKRDVAEQLRLPI